MRRNAKTLLLVFLCLLLAAPAAASNMVVFHQDYTTLGAVPSNIIASNYISPFVGNITVYYNTTGGSVNLTKVTGNVGSVFIGGFTPEVNSTYNIKMRLNRTDWNSVINLNFGNMWLEVQRRSSDEIRVWNFYTGPSGSTLSSYFTTGINLPEPFTLTIFYNGTNKSYTSSIGTYSVTTPFYAAQTNHVTLAEIPYDFVSGNVLEISYGSGAEIAVDLYDINQTVSKTGIVTAIGNNSMVSFGTDATTPSGIQNGAALITPYNGTATYWADNRTIDTTTVNYVKNLLAQGWELGIHFDRQLDPLSLADAQLFIDQEVANITFVFGQSPTSWCSQADVDNVSHAIYAYNTYGMIWRNERMGVQEFSNIGTVDNTSWPWWKNMSGAGITMRGFTHEMDNSPAAAYSVDWEYFQTWLNNYKAAGMTITPFINWYRINANTNVTATTFTTLPDPASDLRFSVDTLNGYPVTALVDMPYDPATVIYDSSGNTVSFRNTGGNISFFAVDGETYGINSNPVAAFTSVPSTGVKPLVVAFTDTTANFPVSWAWNFGDGAASVLQNPSHTYKTSGTYTVTLTSTNLVGTDTTTGTITVYLVGGGVAMGTGADVGRDQVSTAFTMLGIMLIVVGVMGIIYMLISIGGDGAMFVPLVVGSIVSIVVGAVCIILGYIMVGALLGT